MAEGRGTMVKGERLQRFLAGAGIGSRRKCEELIVEGRVSVNGGVVRELGTRVVPRKDKVAVDGLVVKREKPLYLVFNKPKNCLCTCCDDKGRDTVLDYLPGIAQRVFPVGRLDYDAEGLLVLTNDGDFAQRVIHPRHGVGRTYRVKVKGLFNEEGAELLRKGVKLDGKVIRPLGLRVISRGERMSRVEIQVAEGINQQIKRMFRAAGHDVTGIKRTGLGILRIGSLRTGKFRRMTSWEKSWFEGDRSREKRGGGGAATPGEKRRDSEGR